MTDANVRMMLLAAVTTLLLSCASSERKAPIPVLVEQADKTISSGVFSYNQSDYVKAEELFTKALYRYRGIDNPEGIAASCINLAKTRLSQADPQAARQWIDSAQNIIETGGLDHLRNHVTIVSSSIAIETRDYESAKRLLAALLDDADKTIDRLTRLAALQNRTRVAFAENEASAEWTANYAKQVTADEPLHQARLARFRAALSTDKNTGDRQFKDALDTYRKRAYRPGIAATLKEWAQQDIELKDYGSAQDKLERALFIHAEMMDAGGCTEILALFETIHTATGSEDALLMTKHWQQQLETGEFDLWLELTDAYSGFPDSGF